MLCGAMFAKIVLTILNTVFAMIALVMVVLGVFVIYGADFVVSYVEPMLEELRANGIPDASMTQGGFDIYALFQDIAIPMIICGIILFIIAFFGCCGANCENRLCLIIYIAAVGVVIAAEILAIVVMAGGQDTWKQQAIDSANTYLENEYQGSNGTDAVSVVSNVVFMRFNCCTWGDYTLREKKERFDACTQMPVEPPCPPGISCPPGPARGFTIPRKDEVAPGPIEIPFTCCVMDQPFPAISPADLACASAPNDTNAYVSNITTTCYKQVDTVILDHQLQVIMGAVIFLLLQVIILIMAIWVCQSPGKITPV